MTCENATRVGVDDEDGMIAGVKKNGVCRFWADAVDLEELFAKLRGRRGEHSLEGIAVLLLEEVDEGLELARFLPEITGAANETGQAKKGNFLERGRSEEFRGVEVGDGVRGVHPGGVLDEDGTNDDFEGAPGGPPALFAVSVEQGIIILMEDGKGLEGDWGAILANARPASSGGAGRTRVVQREAFGHLSRKISTACWQVKNVALSALPRPCSTVQVLANSQRGDKIGHRAYSVFAMLSVGWTISRERCGCLSV